MKVRVSDSARAYLRRETAYLRSVNPRAALNLAAIMRSANRSLSRFEYLGFEGEALPMPGMRRLIVGDYLLDYEIAQDEVHVLSIRHGRQSETPIDVEADFDYEAVPEPQQIDDP